MKELMRKISCGLVLSLIFHAAIAQNVQGEIKGRLLTQDGKAAAFVTLFLKDTKLKTISNEGGYYAFHNIPAGNYTVITSYVGLQSQSHPLELQQGETRVVDFKLKEDSLELHEVVVFTGKSYNERNI